MSSKNAGIIVTAPWLKSWIDYAIERGLFEINAKGLPVYFSLAVHADQQMDYTEFENESVSRTQRTEIGALRVIDDRQMREMAWPLHADDAAPVGTRS